MVRTGSRRGGVPALVGVGVLAACAAPLPPAPPLVAVRPPTRLLLAARDEGLVRTLEVTVEIAAPDDRPLTVRGRRRPHEPGDDAALELRLGVTDYLGRGPISAGRAVTRLVPFGEDGVALPGQPLRRTFAVDLPPPSPGLARRVRVAARLFPVDLLLGEGRAGGSPLALPPATLETFAGPAPDGLAQALESQKWDAIFLAAVRAPVEDRPQVLRRLRERLPGLEGQAREGVLAALLYLTGQSFVADEQGSWTWKPEREAPR